MAYVKSYIYILGGHRNTTCQVISPNRQMLLIFLKSLWTLSVVIRKDKVIACDVWWHGLQGLPVWFILPFLYTLLIPMWLILSTRLDNWFVRFLDNRVIRRSLFLRFNIIFLNQGWRNSGPGAKCGPRKHAENIFISEISSHLSQQMLVLTA